MCVGIAGFLPDYCRNHVLICIKLGSKCSESECSCKQRTGDKRQLLAFSVSQSNPASSNSLGQYNFVVMNNQ